MTLRSLGRLPGVKTVLQRWRNLSFAGSGRYWDERYATGGTSGDGSQGPLAEFKAEVINRFVAEHDVHSVIELGCGDGQQLALARYDRYIGLDVSPRAVAMCSQRFASDRSKSFFLYDPKSFVDRGGVFTSDCALSLDVLYHLVEDATYHKYMADLFGAARKYVIIYSSNQEHPDRRSKREAAHVFHRAFTRDVEREFPAFALLEQIPNRYPERTFASFWIYERRS